MLGVDNNQLVQDFGACLNCSKGGKRVDGKPFGSSWYFKYANLLLLLNANVSIISKICAQRFSFHSLKVWLDQMF